MKQNINNTLLQKYYICSIFYKIFIDNFLMKDVNKKTNNTHSLVLILHKTFEWILLNASNNT